MASYNHVTVMGNVCRDLELKYLANGTAVAQISLAVNRKWKDQAGETKEEVLFLDCTAWGKTAEVAGQYVRKGNPLLIDGRLKQETWEDRQTGQKRSKIVIVVESLVLCGSKREDGQAPAPRQAAAPASEPPPVDDLDVPF